MNLNLLRYSLHLADDALILGHRNSEWTGHGPILEQDIALSNISLDLIGQARNFYDYASGLAGGNTTEDTLAYLRGPDEYLNCLLVEQENGDWGKTLMRQFLFSAYQFPMYQQMISSSNSLLSAIAEKSLKEVTYHLRWSSEWVIRLGQGTEESQRRMNLAVNDLWMYSEELYTPAVYETKLSEENINTGIGTLKMSWMKKVDEIFKMAGLKFPENIKMKHGGKEGVHTSHLEKYLAKCNTCKGRIREWNGDVKVKVKSKN